MPVSLANSKLVYEGLKECDIRMMSALPETWLVHLIRMAEEDPKMTLVRLAKEEEALTDQIVGPKGVRQRIADEQVKLARAQEELKDVESRQTNSRVDTELLVERRAQLGRDGEPRLVAAARALAGVLAASAAKRERASDRVGARVHAVPPGGRMSRKAAFGAAARRKVDHAA